MAKSGEGARAKLVIAERLTASTVRSASFTIPGEHVLDALALSGKEILVIQALPESAPAVVGSAVVRGVTAMPDESSGIWLDGLRLFPEPTVLPPTESVVLGIELLPAGYSIELATKLRLAAMDEPDVAEHALGPDPGLAARVFAACARTCCLTGIEAPKEHDASEYVIPLLPEAFGGVAERRNLIAVLPHLKNAILTGAISFEDDGALLLAPRRLTPKIIAQLAPDFRFRQPAEPFAIPPEMFRRHRELVFARTALR
jgi:hypothetical protein